MTRGWAGREEEEMGGGAPVLVDCWKQGRWLYGEMENSVDSMDIIYHRTLVVIRCMCLYLLHRKI